MTPEPTKQLIAITDLVALAAAGLKWPKTVESWRWQYRHRARNGLAGAFHKVGGRVCVEPGEFLRLATRKARTIRKPRGAARGRGG